MTKLSSKKRDELKALLEDHIAVTDALRNIGKSSYTTTMFVSDEDANDSVEVAMSHRIAKTALEQQRQWVVAELGKLGVEVE